jgi:alginate O-acetyltransferase complex protein AlgI
MVFSSLTFVFYFLPILLLIYYALPNRRLRNLVLIMFSLFFYSWGEPVWVSLMLISATVDYVNGLIIENNRDNILKKVGLISSIVINLSLLGFFKYSGFMAENLNFLLSTNLPLKEFALPIGISFYTFQTLSYTIDVYRGKTQAQKSYLDLLLFVSLFPQLIAGPIVRYVDIADEIENREESLTQFYIGVKRFITGFSKKIIIANTVGKLAGTLLAADPLRQSVLGSWLGILLFGFQIYYDFSGYSDMAIGLGHMVGFNFKENFNYPYISTSVSEFWRRWHISLGSFFRDYLYIPLGGNKHALLRNMLIVWFLTGLWHGASWNFVLWGVFYGILIMLERTLLKRILKLLPTFIKRIYLIVVVLVGWVLFYFTDLSMGFNLIKTMFGLNGARLYDSMSLLTLRSNLFIVLIAGLFSTPIVPWLKNQFEAYRENPTVKILWPGIHIALLLISIILLVGQTYNPFLYFRF